MRLPRCFIAVGNNLRGGLPGPRDLSQGIWVRHQQHVCIGGFNKIPVLVRILARHRLHHDGLRELEITSAEKLVRWDKLPPRIARHVGYEAFHL